MTLLIIIGVILVIAIFRAIAKASAKVDEQQPMMYIENVTQNFYFNGDDGGGESIDPQPLYVPEDWSSKNVGP